jgi:hypothetical protein
VLPLLQLVFTLNSGVAAILMVLLGGLLVYYSIHRQAYLEAIIWGALWGMGAMAAIFGVFHWYALIVEGLVLVVLLTPWIVVPEWAGILRWFAIGELALTLLLLWGQGQGVPGVTLVTAVLLMALAGLIGAGAYRPFEIRENRRRLAKLVAFMAILLLLLQPVIRPFGELIASPVVSLAQVVSLRVERWKIGEEVKTRALRELQRPLTEAHKARWEKAIQQIHSLPLTPREWEDLGIPHDP